MFRERLFDFSVVPILVFVLFPAFVIKPFFPSAGEIYQYLQFIRDVPVDFPSVIDLWHLWLLFSHRCLRYRSQTGNIVAANA